MPVEAPGHEYLLAEVKVLVATGAFARHERIDLQSLGDQFKVSVTPIRDVLHHLVGERLVTHHPFGGFQSLTPDAAALQHLYAWNGQHLLAALHLLSEPVIRQTIQPIAQPPKLASPRPASPGSTPQERLTVSSYAFPPLRAVFATVREHDAAGAAIRGQPEKRATAPLEPGITG